MSKTALKKEKWTLSFDSRLKRLLIKEAQRKGIYPVALLEEVVRDRFNPYGFSDVKDSVRYVRKIRKGSRKVTDKAFLKEIQAWRKSNS
jgi:hypothetical protein